MFPNDIRFKWKASIDGRHGLRISVVLFNEIPWLKHQTEYHLKRVEKERELKDPEKEENIVKQAENM